MTVQSSSLFPILSHHIYWDHKIKFQLSVDTYEHWVLFAVEGGSFSYRIGAAEGTGTMGDLIICPPGVPFHRSVVHTLSFHFIGFTLGSMIEESVKSNGDEDAIRHHLASSCYKLNITHLERLADNLRFLKEHADSAIEDKSYWQNHALNDIWRFCQRMEDSASVKERVDPLIEQAKLYIRQHGFEEISMLELASELGISPVQLSRRFSNSTGMTPSRYLCHIRLEKVKNMLIDTQLPLEVIAQSCGFNNGFYLSRVFTKIVKTSPSAYRKMNRV
jgi:AraC family transcriptional regulator